MNKNFLLLTSMILTFSIDAKANSFPREYLKEYSDTIKNKSIKINSEEIYDNAQNYQSSNYTISKDSLLRVKNINIDIIGSNENSKLVFKNFSKDFNTSFNDSIFQTLSAYSKINFNNISLNISNNEADFGCFLTLYPGSESQFNNVKLYAKNNKTSIFGGIFCANRTEDRKSIISIKNSIFYFEGNIGDNHYLNDFYNKGRLEIFKSIISLDGGISEFAQNDNQLVGELSISYSKIFTKEGKGIIIQQRYINFKESSIDFIIGLDDINNEYPKIIANKISGDLVIKLNLSLPLDKLINKSNNFSIAGYPIMFADTIDANIKLYEPEYEDINNRPIKFEIHKNNFNNKEVLMLEITKNQGFVPKLINSNKTKKDILHIINENIGMIYIDCLKQENMEE